MTLARPMSHPQFNSPPSVSNPLHTVASKMNQPVGQPMFQSWESGQVNNSLNQTTTLNQQPIQPPIREALRSPLSAPPPQYAYHVAQSQPRAPTPAYQVSPSPLATSNNPSPPYYPTNSKYLESFPIIDLKEPTHHDINRRNTEFKEQEQSIIMGLYTSHDNKDFGQNESGGTSRRFTNVRRAESVGDP